MKLSRRSFLKLTGAAAAASALAGAGMQSRAAAAEQIRVYYAREVPTICTFCGVGCGIICSVKDGLVINTEGDPDHPINEGSLCSKGSSLYNLSYIYDAKGKPRPNPNRLTKPLYRAPGSDRWEEKSWDWMFTEIVKRIKETRDATFEPTDENGVTVNRTDAIAWLGSAICTNEENYLFHKIARAMGVVNIDHCARL
ncbi:MAG: twin-arginine translocation signal domain-containing protein [Firmicutes bacterium]|nr:twin-arginine translocation signal domain-containing protein [Bacillota bacterium]